MWRVGGRKSKRERQRGRNGGREKEEDRERHGYSDLINTLSKCMTLYNNMMITCTHTHLRWSRALNGPL